MERKIMRQSHHSIVNLVDLIVLVLKVFCIKTVKLFLILTFLNFFLIQVHQEVLLPNHGTLLSMIGEWEALLMVLRPLHLVLQHLLAVNLKTGTLQPMPGDLLPPIELQRKLRLNLLQVVEPRMMIGELVLMPGLRAAVLLLVEEQLQVQATKRQPVQLRQTTGIQAGGLLPIRLLQNPILLLNLEVAMIGEPKQTLGQALKEGQLLALTKEMIGEVQPVRAVPGHLAQTLLQEAKELLHGEDQDPVLLPPANQLQSMIGVYLMIHQQLHLLQLHRVVVQQQRRVATIGV